MNLKQMLFFTSPALAALVPDRTRLFWVRIVLSGLCIGMSVMESGDNGVIYSFYLAALTKILFILLHKKGPGVPGLLMNIYEGYFNWNGTNFGARKWCSTKVIT